MESLKPSFYLKVTACAFLWGSAFPVIKNSVTHWNLHSFQDLMAFAGIRFVAAGLIVSLTVRRNLIQQLIIAPKIPLSVVILGHTFFQYLFFYLGLSVSSGTLGALLVGTGSLWWVFLTPFLIRNYPRPGIRDWVIVLIAFLGISIAIYKPGAASGNVPLGSAMFLAASFSGSIATIFLKQIAPIVGSRTTTALSLFIGGLLLLACAGSAITNFFSVLDAELALITLYLALVSATAFSIWNHLVETYSVSLLATYRFLIPLFGAIESAIFIKSETLSLGSLIGGILIIGCVYAASLTHKTKD